MQTAGTQLFGKTIAAMILLCAWTTASPAQTSFGRPDERGAGAKGYVYWTNNADGSVGRATTAGTKANEKFIKPQNTITGAGLTVDKNYIYWTSANGGTSTTIARANLDGSKVNYDFITGAENPCGVAVNSSYIYWAGDVGSSIGRANLDGSDVNQDFITTGTGVCGVAVTKQYIYWANYLTGQIGRAKLDGTDVNDDFISGCGSGVAVEGKYIYFTAASGTAIGRADIDGTDVNTNFIPSLNGEVAFLAADRNYIYWADWDGDAGQTIGRANIDGSKINLKFIKGANGPFGVAVTGGDP
jgi:hypothetical protein